ncbi:MAG: hypothetical protein ACRDHW_06940, partial [Ktedonobacteraceae bacterium]
MGSSTNEDPENSAFDEEDRLDVSRYDTGKGLRPVTGYAMINLLEWLQRNHPEVTRIEGMPPQRFSQLVGEYEASTGNRAEGNWLAGQRFLQDGYSDELGYD